ncbi:MAG: DUF2806 domain-containing protein [Defluviitaleaceae bacterium]|nr:DUF2806 domain-containing protein [Defluviitaleaceae bacterium]
MSNLSLVNLDKIAESIASVANNLINKVSAATGWAFSTKGLKLAQEEAHKKIIDEIAERADVDVYERRQLINMYTDFSKKNENVVKILSKSFKYLEEGANPQDISDDWIMDFVDKASKISDEGMQELWSNLIAGEANKPNSFSKRLLHTLSIMSYKDAEIFLNLTRFCFFDVSDEYLLHPIIFIKRRTGSYAKSRITSDTLNDMASLGLIQCDYNQGFKFDRRKHFHYQNKFITVENDIIDAGNVKFTPMGHMLTRISEKQNHEKILDFTIEEWSHRGYKVTVERRDR